MGMVFRVDRRSRRQGKAYMKRDDKREYDVQECNRRLLVLVRTPLKGNAMGKIAWIGTIQSLALDYIHGRRETYGDSLFDNDKGIGVAIEWLWNQKKI